MEMEYGRNLNKRSRSSVKFDGRICPSRRSLVVLAAGDAMD
jgi:hypothetical protein